MVYQWLKNSLLRAIPQHCILCLAPIKSRAGQSLLLCPACASDLPKNTSPCLICSIPLPKISSHQASLICGDCQKHPPIYQTSIIPNLYASPIKQFITRLKFHADLSSVPLLAQSFIPGLKRSPEKLPECIIPVPLHKARLHKRGFNQALELARPIARHFDLPIEHALCQRNKATPFQSGLSAEERKKNMKNAFSVAKDHNYKHVAIFDDVVTTGTTVNELARQLQKTNVEIIEVWAIARTYHKQ